MTGLVRALKSPSTRTTALLERERAPVDGLAFCVAFGRCAQAASQKHLRRQPRTCVHAEALPVGDAPFSTGTQRRRWHARPRQCTKCTITHPVQLRVKVSGRGADTRAARHSARAGQAWQIYGLNTQASLQRMCRVCMLPKSYACGARRLHEEVDARHWRACAGALQERRLPAYASRRAVAACVSAGGARLEGVSTCIQGGHCWTCRALRNTVATRAQRKGSALVRMLRMHFSRHECGRRSPGAAGQLQTSPISATSRDLSAGAQLQPGSRWRTGKLAPCTAAMGYVLQALMPTQTKRRNLMLQAWLSAGAAQPISHGRMSFGRSLTMPAHIHARAKRNAFTPATSTTTSAWTVRCL